MTDTVSINECFARDGLQHEEVFVPTETKVELLTSFADAGFDRIEATSYSSPRWVPAFSDASEVLRGLPRREDVAYKATCPNQKAVERALADADAGIGAEEISLLSSASDSHSRANLRAYRTEQWQRLEEMADMARGQFRLVGVVSVAFGCPFEGRIPVKTVLSDVARFASLGADVVTIGDTTGLADPYAVRRLMAMLLEEHPDLRIVAHFHDTRGTGIANALAAYDVGVRDFDSAMGGVGGHPKHIQYGSGETGNVATEDLVDMFETMGIDTGLDLEAITRLSRRCERVLGRELHSRVARSGQSRSVLGATSAAPVEVLA